MTADPLQARYRYEALSRPGKDGGPFGQMFDGDELLHDGWPLSAEVLVFESDRCDCGCEGCGLLDIHVHRSGPYVVWTRWVRRSGEPDSWWTPRVFGAQAYGEALGGPVDGLPDLDVAHLAALLGGDRCPPDWVVWWESDGEDPLPDGDAREVYEEILAALTDPSRVAGARLAHGRSQWRIIDECLDVALDLAWVDGEIAVRWGELRRYEGVFVVVPGLVGVVWPNGG